MKTITTKYANDLGYMVLCLLAHYHVTIQCEKDVIKVYSAVTKDGEVFNNLYNAVSFANDLLIAGKGFAE